MRKALILKELRESAAVVGLALAVYFAFVLSYTGVPLLLVQSKEALV